jgi:hypothetical protein
VRVDVRTGRAETHAAIARDQRAELIFRASTHVSRDGKTIAYTQNVVSSALYLIEGVR